MVVIRFAKAVKNNPKKSIAGAIVLAWFGKWAEKRYIAHLFRRAECQTAVKLGQKSLHELQDAKRVTVLLNPAANGGKANALYEKYAAPILHLAGYDVHLVKLNYEGEAKKLMSVVNNDIDMIICAGGDGTLSEIVTGLMRRPDSNWKKIPIGIIPLGKKNTMCRRLIQNADHDKQPHFICSAASAITRSIQTPVDVMKIDGSTGKTVYAVSSISWGTYSDLQDRIKKFWFLGPLKSYIPFVLSLLKSDPTKPRTFSISYTDPEVVPISLEENCVENSSGLSVSSLLSKIFYRFWPWKSKSEPLIEQTAELIEENWNDLPKTSIEFFAQANKHLNSEGREKASIQVQLESNNVSYTDFVTHGPFIFQKGDHPFVNTDSDFEVDKLKLSSQLSDNYEQHISIDNDRYEAMDLSVQLVPNCINMICSK
uniref:acylglycerol kinase, mitochondrial-like n=1 Tax=Styela clava TaxID=7725 RepID=UPI00193A0972|nr:acylglycerol kinase, mitochondrial-like [Styela clava]